MPAEQNIAALRRVIEEAFNKGNYEVLPELFDPHFVEHQFGLQGTIPGMERDIRYLRKAFPDFQLTIEDVIADEDHAWARSTGRGTNLGGFMGAPNGKSIQITVFDAVRLQDGKIVEHWGSPDRFQALVQLGLFTPLR